MSTRTARIEDLAPGAIDDIVGGVRVWVTADDRTVAEAEVSSRGVSVKTAGSAATVTADLQRGRVGTELTLGR